VCEEVLGNGGEAAKVANPLQEQEIRQERMLSALAVSGYGQGLSNDFEQHVYTVVMKMDKYETDD